MDDIHFLQANFDLEGKPLYSPDLVIRPKVPIFVVEDDPSLGQNIARYLQLSLSQNTHWFSSSVECLSYLENLPKSESFCLVTDISLGPGSDGLLLIDLVREKGFRFFSIAMTGFASIQSAISATKRGVQHYLTKPFEMSVLKDVVEQGFQEHFGILLQPKVAAQEESFAPGSGIGKKINYEKILLKAPQKDEIFQAMVGRSESMKQVFQRIEKVASTDSTILITGHSGTGKELVAKAIHQLSPRKNAPMICVNCGAIPSELLESELFGHVKGAFTGAISNRKGRFELAQGGSIFLDEIGDLPLHLQVKLLRAIQQKTIEPIGSGITQQVDVRIIAATHRDLEQAVAEGKFREDLYYRLNVIPIPLPSLKERKEDIPLLLAYFLKRYVSADQRNSIDFTDEAFQMLVNYDWPGNVRELENVIERMVILRAGTTIKAEELPAKIYRHNPLASDYYKNIFQLPADGVDLKKVLSEIEDSLILQAMNRTKGNKNQASRLLSLNRTTLIEKMKKKELHP